MKTIDEIVDIMHSPESSDSSVLWAGSKFDALSKEEVQSLYQRGKISLEELERHPAFEQNTGDICPKNCPCCADELVALKVWGEWNYYLCESCKAIYDYKGNNLNEEDTKNILLSELSII
jgi:hypothetical protein